jgi:hypothetical protein
MVLVTPEQGRHFHRSDHAPQAHGQPGYTPSRKQFRIARIVVRTPVLSARFTGSPGVGIAEVVFLLAGRGPGLRRLPN